METLKIIYTNTELLDYIRRKVAEVEHLITCTDKLEHSIFKQLCNYYRTSKKQSFKHIEYLIDREIGLAKKRYGLDDSIIFSTLIQYDDYGEPQEFEPIDVLANVEDTVLETLYINEEIARLAAGDLENFTLNAWLNGFSDSEISRTLASQNSGKVESYRKAIQRFKARCRRKLLT